MLLYVLYKMTNNIMIKTLPKNTKVAGSIHFSTAVINRYCYSYAKPLE